MSTTNLMNETQLAKQLEDVLLDHDRHVFGNTDMIHHTSVAQNRKNTLSRLLNSLSPNFNEHRLVVIGVPGKYYCFLSRLDLEWLRGKYKGLEPDQKDYEIHLVNFSQYFLAKEIYNISDVTSGD
jgi:hypothetical protein